MFKKILILVVIITTAFLVYKIYTPKPKTIPAPVVVENIQPVSFAWNTKLDTELNPDGLPKTKVSLDVTYSGGSLENKLIGMTDGSCYSLDTSDTDMLKGTTILQCYAAGFGYKFKIVKTEKTYRVMRQEFEEGSPEYNPPVQDYKTILEF